jgi:hypothetical protein
MRRYARSRRPVFQPQVITDACGCEYVTTQDGGRTATVFCSEHAKTCTADGCAVRLDYAHLTHCPEHSEPFVWPLNIEEY